MRNIAACFVASAALAACSGLVDSPSSSRVTASAGSQPGMQQYRDPTASVGPYGPNNFNCDAQRTAPECSAGDLAGTAFGSGSDPGGTSSASTGQSNAGTVAQ